MNRQEFEHVVRAACEVANTYELVVIGSQAILGSLPNAPAAMLMSNEADVYPKQQPELADLIEGAIGEGSMFHERFGYYAQAVGPETAMLAPGWEQRLVKVQNNNTNLKIAWCLSPPDIVVAKLLAGRPKDFDYAQVAIENGVVDCGELEQMLVAVALARGEQAKVARARNWLSRFGSQDSATDTPNPVHR